MFSRLKSLIGRHVVTSEHVLAGHQNFSCAACSLKQMVNERCALGNWRVVSSFLIVKPLHLNAPTTTLALVALNCKSSMSELVTANYACVGICTICDRLKSSIDAMTAFRVFNPFAMSKP